jgi:hypothetical protein
MAIVGPRPVPCTFYRWTVILGMVWYNSTLLLTKITCIILTFNLKSGAEQWSSLYQKTYQLRKIDNSQCFGETPLISFFRKQHIEIRCNEPNDNRLSNTGHTLVKTNMSDINSRLHTRPVKVTVKF